MNKLYILLLASSLLFSAEENTVTNMYLYQENTETRFEYLERVQPFLPTIPEMLHSTLFDPSIIYRKEYPNKTLIIDIPFADLSDAQKLSRPLRPYPLMQYLLEYLSNEEKASAVQKRINF